MAKGFQKGNKLWKLSLRKVEDGYKYCSTCGAEKLLTEFHKNKQRTDGLQNKCKNCMKGFRKYNPIAKKKSAILNNYGLVWEEYIELYNSQEGKCKICKEFISIEINNAKSNDRTKAQIDHNHDTGEVRGLLCMSCNKGLGFLKDNITILENSINYLRECKNVS